MSSEGYGGAAGVPDLDLRPFEVLPDGIWIFDDQGVTIYANRRMAEMLGRRQEEMPGQRFVDFFDAEGSPIFWEWFGVMLRTGQGRENFEAYFYRPDGSTVWGLLSSAPLHDATGRRVGWVHRVAPYTERKLLVDRLLASEHQLAHAQQIAHLGSWERVSSRRFNAAASATCAPTRSSGPTSSTGCWVSHPGSSPPRSS